MSDTNERIALKLGWTPPGSSEHTAQGKVRFRDWTVAELLQRWLSPDGQTFAWLPRFDTDPAAMVELMEDAIARGWNFSIWGSPRCLQIWGSNLARIIDVEWRSDEQLPAAVAAAWLEAREAKDGD